MTKSSRTVETTIGIAGMTCASCELLLERKLQAVPGILSVSVDHRSGTAHLLAQARQAPNAERIAAVVHAAGYSLLDEEVPSVATIAPDQRVWMEAGIALLIALALGKILQTFDIVALAPSTSDVLSVGGILLIGVVAGTSSCLAVTGGLLLAMAARFNERHQSAGAWESFRPLLAFNAGRLLSYGALGGLVGFIGQSITLSTKMTGVMNILIALIMLRMALGMLHILPKGIAFLRPPKRLSRAIAHLADSDHPAAPFALGAGTFFLPCGFTQSLQLVALASGSAVAGAVTMGAFAVGTLPSLLGISAIVSLARGSFSRLFLRLSGAIVLLLALVNLRSGIALTGVSLAAMLPTERRIEAPRPTGDRQDVAMTVGPYGYEPSTLTIRAGQLVRWTVDGTQAGGCTSGLVVPQLGISRTLRRGPNVIEFTAPSSPGTLAFSCTMGMVRGSFQVI